ncbi:hypothetical protein ABPG72_022441 [Tetrahymena utriculariae]
MQVQEFIYPSQSNSFQVEDNIQNLKNQNKQIQYEDEILELQINKIPTLDQNEQINDIIDNENTDPLSFFKKKKIDDICCSSTHFSVQTNYQDLRNQGIMIFEKSEQNQQILFTKLDGSKSEYFLKYISACCQNKHIRDEANNLLEQLKRFLIFYKETKNQQINQSYEIILDLQEKDEKKQNQNALQLANLIEEMQEIQKYEETSQLINPTQLIQDLKNKMQMYYLDLNHNMNLFSANKPQQAKYINISKLLSHLDNVFGETKFQDLYKSQQNALYDGFKDQYKNILQAIEKNDFKAVQIDLMVIYETPNNYTAINQIKAQLQYQIESLIEQANLDSLTVGNQIEKDIIMKVIKNIDLIKKCRQYFKGCFDQTFLENLEKQIEKIIEKIDQKISKYIESIIALLKQADFFEVEEKREHITQIQQLLAGYSKDEENKKNLEDLLKELENKVSEITKIKYDDEKQFIFHPPKQILEKLSKVAGRNLKYSECYINLQNILIDKIRKLISDYSDSDQNQQKQKSIQVEVLLNSVSEELKQILREQFDTSKQQSEYKKKYFQEQFEFVKKTDDLDKKNVYLKQCQLEKMQIFEVEMKMLIQQECQTLFTKFQEEIYNSRPKEGVQLAIKLQEYKDYFNSDNKIKNHCEKAQNVIKNEMKNRVNYLKCIEKIDNTDQYEKEYDLFLDLLQTIKEQKQYFLSSDFEMKLEEFCSAFKNFFIEIFKNFDEHLENDKIQHLEKDLQIIKKWENLVQKLKKDFNKTHYLSSFFQQLQTLDTIQDKILRFKECLDKIVDRLSQFKNDILNFKFIQDLDKNKYYQQIQRSLSILRQANQTKIDFKDTNFNPQCYENECIKNIKKQIEDQEKKVEEVLEKDDISIQNKDYKQINNYFENIQCFKNNVYDPQMIIEQNIEKINKKIEQKIDNIENCINIQNIDSVAQNIIKMKKHSENLHEFKNKIFNQLENFLKNKYFKEKETRTNKMSQLAAHLQADQSGYGIAIIEESEVFKGVSLSIFNEITQKHGVDHVIENTRGDQISKEKLKSIFKKFEKEYQEIVQQKLIIIERNAKAEKEIIEELVTNIKQITNKKVSLNEGKIIWDQKIRQQLPSLIAHIFAIWTLLNTQYFKQVSDSENKQNYLFKPHAGQVISVFRLLGLGYEKENLYSNLVQLGTGEGKSIILAITSIIFTLFGIDVYCACYSEYLIQRDYSSSLKLFDTIGVTSNIKYGIFNKICEQIINEHGQIRDLTVKYISNGFSERSKDQSKDKEIKPTILLIDEVDVFFSQDFYGKLYNPIARLQDQCISDLAEFIWGKRKNNLSLKDIQETQIYKQCICKFKNLNCMIDEAIKDMISDSKNFNHKYIIQNHQIGYQEQDSISFNIAYGYKTFIKCGSFSYSEIPFRFNCIAGVTGTLETLSDPEKKIIKNIYNITKNTYIPSVFGKNKRKFAEKKDIYVENEDDYFKQQKLNKFYNSTELSDLKMDVELITEELLTDKLQLIKKATVSGQVTLLTDSFGRGTDFICHDQRVLNNGGVHVIQTFYSNKKSEEVQIMGRSARQGQDGSYSLVLLDQELQNIIGPNYQKVLEQMRQENNFYEKLGELRKIREAQEYDNRNKFIEQIQKEHLEGQKFVQAMLNKDETFVKEFLANKNKGANNIQKLIRILCLVDGTASMGPLLNKAKVTVSEMFERSCLIIKKSDKNIPEDCFQLQFAVYRDYDQLESILQASPWESKVDNLQLFLETIKPKGGEDYEEAVEIGLQHANQENDNQELTAIILLADAPSKNMSQIKSYRNKYGGESYWKKTKYSQITDYKQEIEKLNNANIPIHCFYLHDRAKSNFDEIAEFTGGKCDRFNIDCEEASNTLIKVVVEPILKNVGKQNGLGDELYQEYLKLFDKSYK